jgi:hypothetical protein
MSIHKHPRRGHYRSAIVAVAAAVLVAAACVPPAWDWQLSSTVPDPALPGRVTGDPPTPGPPSSAFTDVACAPGPAGGRCLAVGFAVTPDGRRPFSATYDASRWALTVVPAPSAGGPFGWRGAFDSLACASPTSCLASIVDQSGGEPFQMVRWDGTAWGRLVEPLPDAMSGPRQVACAPDGCVVVSMGRLAVGDASGAGWQVTPTPGQFFGEKMTCASVSRCVGLHDRGRPQEVRVWDGRAVTVLDKAVTDQIGLNLDASCAPAGSCVVFGTDGALHGTGGTWTFQPSAIELEYGSCTSDTNCRAIGTDRRTNALVTMLWNGTAWRRDPYSTPKFTAAPLINVGSLACVPVFCLHVGSSMPFYRYDGSQPSRPAAETLHARL